MMMTNDDETLNQPFLLTIEYIDEDQDDSSSINNETSNECWRRALQELLSTEQDYNHKLHLALNAVQTIGDRGAFEWEAVELRAAILPICATSTALIGKLEYLLSLWSVRQASGAANTKQQFDFQILFGKNLWSAYDQYHDSYVEFLYPLIRYRRRYDRRFAKILLDIQSKQGYLLEHLLLLPVTFTFVS